MNNATRFCSFFSFLFSIHLDGGFGVVVVVVVCYYQISKKRHYYSFQEWNVEQAEHRTPEIPQENVVPAAPLPINFGKKNDYSVSYVLPKEWGDVVLSNQSSTILLWLSPHPYPGLADCFPNPKAKMKCEVSDLAEMGGDWRANQADCVGHKITAFITCIFSWLPDQVHKRPLETANRSHETTFFYFPHSFPSSHPWRCDPNISTST